MKILDRYVWKELLSPFALGILIFTFLLLVDKVFDLTDLIINKGVPVHMVVQLLGFILPAFMVLTIPIGFLLAILVAFGRLSGDMEVVALKASGVSPLRLLRPVLVFALGVAGLTAYLMFEAVPKANYAYKSLVFDILRTQASVGLKERIFNDSFGNFVIYVDEMAADQVSLRRVFVADERRPDEIRVVTAKEGRLIADEKERRLTLRLTDGAVHETTTQDLKKYRQISFEQYDLTLVLENPLLKDGQAAKGDREMTVAELGAEAEAALRQRRNPNPYLVERHKKYAIPVACLVFGLVGVPLGIRTHRGGRWAAFVVLLPIVLFYYVFLTTGETLADRGVVPPWLAMWGSNIAVSILGAYLLWAAVKERSIPVVEWVRKGFWALFDRARPLARRWAGRWAGRADRRAGPGGRRRRPAARRQTLHIVDRYLAHEFLTIFVYGVALAAVVVVVGDLMVTIERYMRTKPSLIHVLQHFLYRTPPFVYEALHLVVLMSTILLFLGLSRSNELTALKAGGVSLYRVGLPVFGLAILVTIGGLGFQEMIMPVLNQRGTEVDESKIKRRTLPHLRKRSQIWYRGRDAQTGEGRIYHIELVDPANQQMSGVSIFELRADFGLRGRWDARRMNWSEALESWRLRDGVRREFDPGNPDRLDAFKERTVRLSERMSDFAQVPKAPDVMNYLELRDYIGRLRESGHQVGKYLVDLHAKLAFPFAHPIMVLVGIPFALQSPRGGRLIGVALCLILGLTYFLVHSAAVALARSDLLPPALAAWAANVLFAMLGLYLFLRART